MSEGRRSITYSRFALVDALNAEWSELDGNHRLAGYGRAEVGRWAADHPALVGCGSAGDVLQAIRDRPDEVLAALIAVHQEGTRHNRVGSSGRPAGELAGRIVLQTMLGKLVTMARRDHRHAVEDYVGQLWARIGCYPLARRPRRIAANLALDTLKAVTRDHTRGSSRVAVAVPVSEEDLERAGLVADPRVGDGVDDLSAHRVLRTAQDLDLIDDATRRLLLSVYLEGLSSVDAAARFGLAPTTVRYRCSRAIRNLAAHATVIRDAA
ncbi:RNA polymerase sigma factor [Microlunatus soli]|uniref:DNA-directed RNA polymerase specialized sigma subunit, sigma24 family n=1 Tax=Microlunatus soli TaxID=630515 RepID=A0A1H1UN54_9ACTN|nr:sigma factor-like helix-turn-helix DNA-binding protein [Microlunatus soli]SDS73915.1 DNA-directed RNA polymerase specialized sigma subunit, sigma24 family [Microlunatus soli]